MVIPLDPECYIYFSLIKKFNRFFQSSHFIWPRFVHTSVTAHQYIYNKWVLQFQVATSFFFRCSHFSNTSLAWRLHHRYDRKIIPKDSQREIYFRHGGRPVNDTTIIMKKCSDWWKHFRSSLRVAGKEFLLFERKKCFRIIFDRLGQNNIRQTTIFVRPHPSTTLENSPRPAFPPSFAQNHGPLPKGLETRRWARGCRRRAKLEDLQGTRLHL